MIIFRVFKDIFFPNKDTPSLQVTQEDKRPFIRKKEIPSVLVLTHSYQGNGAAVMLVFLLEWLVRIRGWQVQALATGLPNGDKKYIERIGVGLVDAVNPEQYDFAICNTVVSGLGHIEKIGNHLPCLLWVHEGEFVLWNSRIPLGDWKRIISLTKHVVFQTHWQAERIFGSFTSGFPEARYSVIPNCLPSMSQEAKRETASIGSEKRVVFVGGVYDRKRPFDLVQAVLKLDRDDLECIFVGTSDHLPHEMRALLKSDKRFRLTGEVSREEATAILASASVLSLPSSDESQPLVLLEAAHLDVPIVISNLPVYRNIWINGENCLMHEVGDIDSLAMHLETCLAGRAPRPILSSIGNFSRQTFYGRFDKVFRDILPEALKHYGE